MSRRDRAPHAPRLAAPLLWLSLVPLASPSRAAEPGSATAEPARLTVVDRAIALERAEWVRWRIDYHLRNDGTETLVVPPEALSARVAGWVSNSRAPGHSNPRRSEVEASGGSGLVGVAEVIASTHEVERCRERLIVQAWPAESGSTPPDPIARATVNKPAPVEEQPTLEVAPGASLRVRLGLEHEHQLCGPHTALLGRRELALRLGPATLADVLPLDRQLPVDAPRVDWPPPPPEGLRDDRIFLSPPDSLHLQAHLPGRRSHSYPEYRDVAGGARLRLSFWYLVAPGTAGNCQLRMTQHRDLPSSFKTLYDGEMIEHLTTVGRWVHVERVVRAEPEATVLKLDFRIADSPVNVGELWIDDVLLEPLDDEALAGP